MCGGAEKAVGVGLGKLTIGEPINDIQSVELCIWGRRGETTFRISS